jgi:hypothetical protein
MELWLLRPYARQYLMLLAFGLLFALMQNTAIPLVTMMAVLTGSYGFSITENARLETLMATLPTSRRAVVVARFGISAAVVAVAATTGLAFEAVLSVVRGQAWSLPVALAVLGGSLAVAGIALGVQFPVYFKLGYTRARSFGFISLAAVGLAVAGIGLVVVKSGALDGTALPPTGTLLALAAGGLLLGAAAMAVSMLVSVRIYQAKDL